jgi:hypothetical protein
VNLIWTLKRLSNMGPAEILHRVVEQAHRARWARVPASWSRWNALALTPPTALVDRLDLAPLPLRDAIAEDAARILAGEFSALGRDWPTRTPDALFPAEFWRLDPVTGKLWPGAETHCFAVDFRHDGSRGDVKYVWEPNRLQDFVILAADWRLHRRPESLAAIAAGIGSWHDSNPPFGGVAWASGIEVALRSISLVLVLALAGDALPVEVTQQIGQILVASRYWLERFPSLHSSANNHRVAELAGLVAIAVATGGDTARWMAALEAELLKQIYPDGSPAEQSPNYGAFAVEMALVARQLAGSVLRPNLDERLGAFARYATALGPSQFLAPGDDDEGRVLRDPSAPEDYPAAIATAIAAAPGAGATDTLRGLLFGAGLPAPAAPSGLTSFRDGGLSIYRGVVAGRELRLGFDHGPLGYLSIAAHGHADALALTLAIDDMPVLVDPGTYLYGSGGAWRRWFRGTPAHNTLNIGGENQSLIAGAFNWTQHAASELIEALEEDGILKLAARHDGYRRRFGVTHRRDVTLTGDELVVHDLLLDAADPISVEIVWQLGPDIEVELAQGGIRLVADGAPLATLVLPKGELVVNKGAPGEDGGWVSPRFGKLAPATRIAWRGPVGAAGVETRLRIAAAGA